jgi:hypothetical protein
MNFVDCYSAACSGFLRLGLVCFFGLLDSLADSSTLLAVFSPPDFRLSGRKPRESTLPVGSTWHTSVLRPTLTRNLKTDKPFQDLAVCLHHNILGPVTVPATYPPKNGRSIRVIKICFDANLLARCSTGTFHAFLIKFKQLELHFIAST